MNELLDLLKNLILEKDSSAIHFRKRILDLYDEYENDILIAKGDINLIANAQAAFNFKLSLLRTEISSERMRNPDSVDERFNYIQQRQFLQYLVDMDISTKIQRIFLLRGF